MGGQTRQSRAASVCFADGFPCGGGLFGVRQPHRYGRAYARFTLDAQAVGIAEAVLQPAVNIPDAHMAVFGGGLLGAGLLQGFGGLRRGHAHTVIAQEDQHIAVCSVPLDPQGHLTGAALRLNAVEDGVLDQRLQRKAGDQAAVGKVFVLDIADIKGDRAAVAVLLDREIVVEQAAQAAHCPWKRFSAGGRAP